MTRFPIDGTGRIASEREHPSAALTGPAGGDLTGNFPNPTVASWVVSDHAPHGATAGKRLTYNGSAFVASAQPIDVWNTQTNPGAVTDWGPIINTLIAGATLSNGGMALYFQPGAYPFSTTINVATKMSVTFLGPGGKVDIYGNSATGGSGTTLRMPAYLRFTGTGSGIALNCTGSSGFVMRGLGLYYDSNSFTGKLIALDGNAAGSVFESNDIGALDRAHLSALCNVHISDSWNHTFRDNTIQGAQYNFYGNDPTTALEFSDSVRIVDNDLAYVSAAHIGGAFHDQWKIINNFISLTVPPTAAGGSLYPQLMNLTKPSGGVNYPATFEFMHNDCWDSPIADDARTRPAFVLGQQVFAKIKYNRVDAFCGSKPVIQGTGGGALVVEDNQTMGSPVYQTGPRVDLGDTTAGAGVFTNVTIKRNGVLTGVTSEEVINRFGHYGLEIDAGDQCWQSYVQPTRELSGQERVTKRLSWPAPSVAPNANLGTGATVTVFGNDMVGLIHLNVGTGPSAGDFAAVTFGTPLMADPNGPFGFTSGHAGQVILLTPTYSGGAPPQAPPVFYSWFNSADNTKWTLGSKTALLAGWDYYVAYRIAAI